MKLSVSMTIIESIKAELRQALPEVKSSHRAEALARGLGWATNAAMHAALAHGVADREVSAEAFTIYLARRGFEVTDRALPDAVLRSQIRAVMSKHGQLTHHGFGVSRGDRISVEAWRALFREQRAEMVAPPALGEFERACEYLVMLERTPYPTKRFDTYNLKHSAERWHEHRNTGGRWDREYVSNGMLLAAAYHLGLQVKPVSRDAFSGYLNISTASVRRLDEMRKPPFPQPDDGEPFRALGTARSDKGKVHYCYSRSGDTGLTRMRPDEHTKRNLLNLAPLEYWTNRFPPLNRRSPFDILSAISEVFKRAADAGPFDPDRYCHSI